MKQYTHQKLTDNQHETIPCCPQALSFLIQCYFVFICFALFILLLLYLCIVLVSCTVVSLFLLLLYLCIVLVSCTVVSLYLWEARLQAQPSVQPLSLTKIDDNNNNNRFNESYLKI